MVDKQVKVQIVAEVDDDEVEALEKTINAITDENGMIIAIDVEDEEVDAAKEKEDELNGSAEFDIDVDETAVQTAMSNLSDGISKAKAGVLDLKNAIQEVEQAGMQSEQNKAFLEMNLGAEKAKQTYQDISDIVASMPGDDNTMRSVLSTAQALGNDLKPDEMKAATKTMADYMAGSATMGKMATESQQDIMKYLLDGNTAELERGSIVSSQVDKLKEATTFMERQQAMQEVLNELGYGGISTQDTMLNKQAEWEGMIYNSQDALSSMWLGAEKGAMDYILQLNDATNGLVGMGIVAGSVAGGPIIDTVSGLGQMATGMKAIKDLGFITWLKDLEIMTKLSAAADWLLSGAQAVLNAVMAMNPIVLVVLALVALAAALIWAYYNVDWFREMVDNAWASLVQMAGVVWSYIQPVIQWLSDAFNSFTSQLGLNTNDWTQAVLGFLLFIPQLPARLAVVLANAIAKVLGFGNNFVQRMYNTGVQSVNRFIGQITSLPGRLQTELNNMLSAVNTWASTLPQKFWDAGVNAVKNFLSALGIASPGTMQRSLVWEISEMGRRTPIEARPLLENMSRLGSDIVDEFGDPTLGVGFETMNSSLVGNADGFGQILNLNIEVGTVDSEDRVQEIVDAVTRALAWNNATAGRRV